MKRKCNWLAAIFFLVLLCGCDGRQGDLLLAQAIYQEQEAQAVQLRILCLESEPSANAEDAQPKPVLLAGKGVTLEEAWQAAQQQAGGQVFLGQCRVWMLGLGQAKQLNPEDAEFWMQQDPGCGSMDLWLVDVSPQALDEPEQRTALADAVENVQEDSPAYLAAGQELLLLPQVKLSAAAAKEEAEVLYRAGRPVLRWAGAERALALWMQGTTQTLTFRREDGSFAVKRPMCTIAAENGELVFQLEGRLEEPKKTSVLSQAQVEQWLQTVAEEVLEQTQAAGADWFCIQGQLRQRTGNEKGRTRVQVRLVAD